MCNITARGTFNGQALTDIPVLNPGDWLGKAWLIEIADSYWPTYLAVEADSVSDAIDELADSTKYGHLITVDEQDLGDYPEEDRHYGPSGQVIDLDHVMVYGQEGSACRWPCRYFGQELPDEGMPPTDYWRREDEE